MEGRDVENKEWWASAVPFYAWKGFNKLSVAKNLDAEFDPVGEV